MTTVEFWGIFMDSISTILAAAAIFLYIIFWYKDKTSNNYDVFDSLYMDILKTGMEHPHFRDISKTKSYKSSFDENSLIQYEIYAYISWNFLETLLDKGDKQLLVTWLPVIKYETSIHFEWFRASENQVKFKKEFIQQINNIIIE